MPVRRSLAIVFTLLIIASFTADAAALTPEMKARGQDAVTRLNLYRRLLGLAEVLLDDTLSEGCALHAAYLDLNIDQINAGLDAHNEYADRPGYTDAGKDAGINSDISYGFMGAEAVTVWFNIYYHRNPMLSPGLQKIGYGDDPGTKAGYSISVLRFFSYSGTPDALTPAPNSKGNPTHPQTGEVPAPVPNFGSKNGIPIIAYFASIGPRVAWVSSTITANGQTLPHGVIAPNKPANPDYEVNEIALITDTVLPAGSAINVSITYTLDNGPQQVKEWIFYTSADGVFDPIAAGGGSTGSGSGVDDVTDSDGDGFPDLVETTAGTSLIDPASTPFAGLPAGTAQSLPVFKVQIKLNFAKPGDSISASGTLPVADGFVFTGQQVITNVGGVVKVFTLDAKGKSAASTTQKFSLSKPKLGVSKFSLKLSKGTFAAAFADESLTGNLDVKKESRSTRVTIYFNQVTYTKTQSLEYTAKKAKTGSAKQL